MSIFGKLLKTAFDVVTIPVDVVKDAATLGGSVLGNDRTFTGKKLSQLSDDASEIRDELDNL